MKAIHVLAAAGLAGLAYWYLKPAAGAGAGTGTTEKAPVATSTVAQYDSSKAQAVALDPTGAKQITVAPGTSLTFSNPMTGTIWSGQGVVSSNPSIVAPVPGSFSNFQVVAGGNGAVVTGYYTDNAGALKQASVTVLVP